MSAEKNKKVKDEIDEKIDRLHKQHKAETVALRKLLAGLEKIEIAKNDGAAKN